MTDSALPSVRIAPPPEGWRARPRESRADSNARRSLAFGIAALVANVILVPSVIAIVAGRKALRGGTAHHGYAVFGIAAGIVGAAVIVLEVLVVVLIGAGLAAAGY